MWRMMTRTAPGRRQMITTKLEKKVATRLKIDLDLAPYDLDAERLSDVHTYPEWDFRRQIYR